jgi:uncharacterized protein YkwD
LPNRHLRLAAPLAGLILGFAALAFSPAWSGQSALAAGAADTQAREIVSLINGERTYLGKRALATDSYLASKARDGSIACPNDSSLVMAGRAKDIAAYGYFSHNLRLCTKYTSIDAMATWGYKGGRGEILASNRGYSGTMTYTYGCSPSVSTCPGTTVTVSSMAAHAMAGWMRSSGHYSIIVGGYDRVGCGAWVGSDGTYVYSCLFSLGARSGGGGGGGGGGATPKPVSHTASQPPAAGTPSATEPDLAAESLAPWATPSGATGLLYALPVASAGDAGSVGQSGGTGSSQPSSSDPSSSVPVLAGASVAAGAGALVSLALVVLPRRRRRGPPAG